MKFILSGVVIFLFAAQANAQYFFKEIINTNLTNLEQSKYQDKKVRSIQIKSIESDGTPSEGFFAENKLSRDYKSNELFTRTNFNGASLFISSFDNSGRLISVYDSSKTAVSRTNYSYNNSGLINKVDSHIWSLDDDFKTEIREDHIYHYDSDDVLTKMVKYKNLKDSTVYLFAQDEQGHIAVEKNTTTGEKYYYYYDENNRLTDVVLANDLKKNLYPQYIFKYNRIGQLVEMTTTEEGGNNADYTVWKYGYDDGLRVSERCYSKERKLLGSVEYNYKKR